MKKSVLFLIFVVFAHLAKSQRFIYIEDGMPGEKQLKDKLLKASQFVARNPIMSDYTIKTAATMKDASGNASISMVVIDSVTLQPVFQAHEEYQSFKSSTQKELLLEMAVKTFIEKNMMLALASVKFDHQEGLNRFCLPSRPRI